MDPNETLYDIRQLVTRIIDAEMDDETDTVSFRADAVELANKFDSLDDWLSQSGFRPDDWTVL